MGWHYCRDDPGDCYSIGWQFAGDWPWCQPHQPQPQRGEDTPSAQDIGTSAILMIALTVVVSVAMLRRALQVVPIKETLCLTA